MLETVLSSLSHLRPGYTGAMPLLWLLYLLWPHKRATLKDHINICNGLLLLLIGINLLHWAYQLFAAWYGQSAYEQWAVPDGSLGLSYIATHLLLSCITAILLLSKRGRSTIVVSLLAWLFSFAFLTAFISEKLTPLFFSDYLPSSWSVKPISFYQRWFGWLLPTLAFAATTLVLYWLQHFYRKHRATVTAPAADHPPKTKKL